MLPNPLDYMSLGALIPTVLTFACLGVFINRRYVSPLRNVPGPFLASFTTAWQIYHTWKGDIEHAVMAEHKKYGDFVRISHKEVSCRHPDSIVNAIAPQYWKHDWYHALAVPDLSHQTPMSEIDPKRHRERSSVTAEAYRFSYLMKSESLVDEIMEELVTKLTAFADTGKAIHLDHWLNYFAFDVVGQLTFSQRFGFVTKGMDIKNAIQNVRFVMLYQTVIGYMYWLHPIFLKTPLGDWLGFRPHAHLHETTVRVLEKRKEDPDKRQDMVAIWINNHRKHPERMAEQEIEAVAGMTLIAGSETLTSAMSTIFYFMVQYPECYAKLKKELDDAQEAGKLSDIVLNSEIKELPYLQAVVKETLRYFPPVPFGFPRVAPKDGVMIGDQHFKAGTVLSVNPYVLSRDVRYFGGDAASFNPERWLRPEAPQYEKYMLQFGTGYNGCPGKLFAYAEMHKIAATLMRDFEFELKDKGTEWVSHSQFTVVTKDWPVTLKSRRAVRA